jgi:hypothetical protein
MAGWRLKKKVRVYIYREEKEGVKKKSLLSRGACTPFYKTREAGYMCGERKRKRWGCACSTGVREEPGKWPRE